MLPMPKLSKRERGDRVAFYGPMCSGKTWCANYLTNHHPNWAKVSFADRLKSLAYEFYGITGKDGNNRTILQQLGQDIRKHDPNIWINLTLRRIQNLEIASVKYPPNIVIDDLRYTNEAEFLKRNGFILVQCTVPEDIRQDRISKLYPNTDSNNLSHASEQEWANIPADYVVSCTDPVTTGAFLEKYIIEFSKIFGD